MSSKRKIKNKKQLTTIIFFIIIILIAIFSDRSNYNQNTNETNNYNTENISTSTNTTNLDINNIPDYQGDVCIKINNNKPNFSESDYTTKAFENYSELDSIGRCGVAYANVCKEIMPKDGEERESISSVHPTGWKQIKVNGEYLYNRCHLIAHSLSDENANKQNLITGTRYFNVEGMLPNENIVLEYINKNPNNHVLYRVTPVFKGQNLVASGVEMEAYSVEDNGQGVEFNVFVYNIQPGVNINYATGELINN